MDKNLATRGRHWALYVGSLAIVGVGAAQAQPGTGRQPFAIHAQALSNAPNAKKLGMQQSDPAPMAGANAPAGSLERIRAWETVEEYNYAEKQFEDRLSDWVHKPGNENKSEAQIENELGLKKPDSAKALKAALRVAQANPTDDLGFMALTFCFYTSPAAHATVLHLLEKYYLNDMRLEDFTVGLARFGGKPGIALLDKIVKQSTKRQLRAQAAYWSAYERMRLVDDLSISEGERNAVRADVTRLARLVASRYGDVQIAGESGTGSQMIKPVLYALEHLSVGSELPDASAPRIGGGMERLSQYRGKVLLLDFWATWCVPCVHSMPKVVKLKQELKGRPFEVITLSIDESASAVQDFMKKRMDLPFVNWHIGDHSKLYDSWDIQGVPSYILVDEKGVVQGISNDVETLSPRVRKLAGA